MLDKEKLKVAHHEANEHLEKAYENKKKCAEHTERIIKDKLRY